MKLALPAECGTDPVQAGLYNHACLHNTLRVLFKSLNASIFLHSKKYSRTFSSCFDAVASSGKIAGFPGKFKLLSNRK
jgi:hypothetical protein